MPSLAFVRPQLEDGFAFQLAERTRPTAELTHTAASVLSLAALVRCCATVAASSVTPRLGVLIAVAFVSLVAHARALHVVAQPSQVLSPILLKPGMQTIVSPRIKPCMQMSM